MDILSEIVEMEFENQGLKNENRIILVFYVGTSTFELPNQSK